MLKSESKEWSILDRDEIKAVHESDLLGLLDSLGEKGPIENGERTCIYCNRIITTENLEAIIPLDNSIGFSCNNTECIAKLMSER